jgi:hypothetical protein
MNELKPIGDTHRYDADFYAWSTEQAQRIRLLKPRDIDWENVAEEIESLGKSQKQALASNLSVILEHRIKWQYQPERRTSSWSHSIDEHRDRIERSIADSPSFLRVARSILAEEYGRARRRALRETGLSDGGIPKTCPFTVEQVLDSDYLP